MHSLHRHLKQYAKRLKSEAICPKIKKLRIKLLTSVVLPTKMVPHVLEFISFTQSRKYFLINSALWKKWRRLNHCKHHSLFSYAKFSLNSKLSFILRTVISDTCVINWDYILLQNASLYIYQSIKPHICAMFTAHNKLYNTDVSSLIFWEFTT